MAGQNTITIAISIPIVAAACRLCRNRPAVQHILWAVVLLKFLTPPLVFWPWPVQRFSPALESNRAVESNPRRMVPFDRRVDAANGAPIESGTQKAIGDLHRPSARVPFETARQSLSFSNREALERTALWLLTGTWSMGIVLCTVRQATRIRRLASLVRRAKAARSSSPRKSKRSPSDSVCGLLAPWSRGALSRHSCGSWAGFVWSGPRRCPEATKSRLARSHRSRARPYPPRRPLPGMGRAARRPPLVVEPALLVSPQASS